MEWGSQLGPPADGAELCEGGLGEKPSVSPFERGEIGNAIVALRYPLFMVKPDTFVLSIKHGVTSGTGAILGEDVTVTDHPADERAVKNCHMFLQIGIEPIRAVERIRAMMYLVLVLFGKWSPGCWLGFALCADNLAGVLHCATEVFRLLAGKCEAGDRALLHEDDLWAGDRDCEVSESE